MTLKLVAKYGDMNNVGGTVDQLRHKEEVLLRHCETVGRDPSEIERTTGIGTVFIRDDRAEAERLFREAFERNRVARHWTDQPVGTVEDVVEKLAPEGGARLPAPHRRHARDLRRGVDGPVRDRGQAAARARLRLKPRRTRRRAVVAVCRGGDRAAGVLGPLPRPEPADLRAVAA